MKKFIKSFFNKPSESNTSGSESGKYMPKIQDPIEERFTYNFTKNGGKFLYCEDKNECDEFFNKILEENNWKDVEILCYDDSLQNLFSKKSKLLISKTNLNSKFFLTTCEFLVWKVFHLICFIFKNIKNSSSQSTLRKSIIYKVKKIGRIGY